MWSITGLPAKTGMPPPVSGDYSQITARSKMGMDNIYFVPPANVNYFFKGKDVLSFGV